MRTQYTTNRVAHDEMGSMTEIQSCKPEVFSKPFTVSYQIVGAKNLPWTEEVPSQAMVLAITYEYLIDRKSQLLGYFERLRFSAIPSYTAVILV